MTKSSIEPVSSNRGGIGSAVVAHLDCASGVSGDMLLGALVDAGFPIETLRRQLARLRLSGYQIDAKPVLRNGVSGTHVDIQIKGAQPVRRWEDARKTLVNSPLPAEIKAKSLDIIKSLFRAEGRIHGKPWNRTHLHELGAVDCLLDIVGTVAGLRYFRVSRLSASPVNTGSGQISTEHGQLPVPAPATSVLLEGLPVYSSDEGVELTTPTGAVLVSNLAQQFGPLPEMVLERVGTGAGTKDFASRSNVLRIFIGTAPESEASDSVVILETNIDDMEPRIYEHVMNRLLQAGALDVFLTPVIMKKSRPAVRISVIALPGTVVALQRILLHETTTLGVRAFEAGRRILDRRIIRVPTPYGNVRVKLALLEGRVIRWMPEYEDCRRAALRHGVPLKSVIRTAEKEARTRGDR